MAGWEFWGGFEFESLLIIPVTLTFAEYPSLYGLLALMLSY